MSIYWSLRNVPELASLTRKQRGQVHEQCLQRYFFRAPANIRSVLAFLSAIFITSGFASLASRLPSWFGMPHKFWAIPLGAIVGMTIGRYVLSRIAIPTLRPFYHEFIKGDLVRSEHAA